MSNRYKSVLDQSSEYQKHCPWQKKSLLGKITVTLIQRLEDLDLGTWTWMLGFGDLDSETVTVNY